MHLERVIDLLHELEACQPDAESASLSRPPGRSRTPSTPARPPSRSTWTAQRVDRGQGAQLGYLPEPVHEQLGS